MAITFRTDRYRCILIPLVITVGATFEYFQFEPYIVLIRLSYAKNYLKTANKIGEFVKFPVSTLRVIRNLLRLLLRGVSHRLRLDPKIENRCIAYNNYSRRIQLQFATNKIKIHPSERPLESFKLSEKGAGTPVCLMTSQFQRISILY